MIHALAHAFAARFGRSPELAARAPGRVNLIGEHTDYNEGLVLPCAIDRATHVVAARRQDGRFRVWSRDLDAEASFALERLARCGSWVDYVQGVVFALREKGMVGPGLDLALASQVPRESGLSSSAALEVAVVSVLDQAWALGLDATQRASLAHRAESRFVGVGCGIMDQFASSLGRRDHALRIDCRSLAVQPVPLPRQALSLLLVDSGVRRSLADGAYGDRRAECEEALRAARAAGVAGPEVRALRDLGPAQLGDLERSLPPLLFRRARHVLTENQRVDAVCAALQAGDAEAVGGLLRQGMRSLRDDFEVSTPELDALCERADAHPGVLGSRLTGAGFGGCTLHLVRPDAVRDAGAWIASGFTERFARRPALMEVRASDGAGSLTLA